MEARTSQASITFSCKPSSLTHQKIQDRHLNFTPKCWKKSFRVHAGTSLGGLPGSLSSRHPLLAFVNDYSTSISAATSPPSSVACENRYWMVLLERPPEEAVQSKEEVTNYYVGCLQKVLGSDNDAQSCIYDISYDGTQFGFCCDVDEDASRALAGLPEVLLVRPDLDRDSALKDYSVQPKGSGLEFQKGRALLFPPGSSKHWLVRTDNPLVTVNNKAEMVDYYVQILTKVLGNEKDAQMCIYHVSLLPSYSGFCCEVDEECARKLTGVPGVLSVRPDDNFVSENKDYEGNGLLKSSKSSDALDSSASTQVKTKKLFITGLSFYTSEKTLRAAFEPFGELVEVKVITDKISKRSKGYAFVEYATEEAAGKALKEMNGKIINGWMIVVDVAKSKPRFSSSRVGQNPRF